MRSSVLVRDGGVWPFSGTLSVRGRIRELVRHLVKIVTDHEARLRERIVVRDAGAAEAASDTELGEQVDEARGGHGRTAIVVDRDGPGGDVVALDGRREELLGEGAGLLLGHDPRNRVATAQV